MIYDIPLGPDLTSPIVAVPSGPDGESLISVRYLMINRSPVQDFRSNPIKTTLLSQLGVLLAPSGAPKPEIEYIGFTYRSAIPVADAIRGVYDGIGFKCPPLFYVRCNKYFRQEDESGRSRQAEIARLSRVLEVGAKTVIIDQFVSSGQTLAYASGVVEEATLVAPDTITGKWYGDATHIDVDTSLMTSPVAAQMHQIGVMCAELYMGGPRIVPIPTS